MEFDEYDEGLMDPLSKHMAEKAKNYFPEVLDIKGQRLIRHVSSDPSDNISAFVDLIDDCMGKLYKSHKGPSWKEDKILELSEVGLVSVWYSPESKATNCVHALIVFKMTDLSYGKTLYLYEIQVTPDCQGFHVGSKLISRFHDYAFHLQLTASEQSPACSHSGFCHTDYTGLTVFSDNDRALEWYEKLGYTLSDDSPLDKNIRTRVIKPDYYELCRPVKEPETI